MRRRPPPGPDRDEFAQFSIFALTSSGWPCAISRRSRSAFRQWKRTVLYRVRPAVERASTRYDCRVWPSRTTGLFSRIAADLRRQRDRRRRGPRARGAPHLRPRGRCLHQRPHRPAGLPALPYRARLSWAAPRPRLTRHRHSQRALAFRRGAARSRFAATRRAAASAARAQATSSSGSSNSRSGARQNERSMVSPFFS